MNHKWKRNSLVAAVPLAGVLVGCLAAQEDMDDLLEQETAFRNGPTPALSLRIVDEGPGHAVAEEAYEAVCGIKEELREGGLEFLNDLILTSIDQAKIGVAFGTDAAGDANPCQIDVAVGAEAMGGYAVHLRAFQTGARGEFMTMAPVENAAACDGDGFYFQANEGGVNDSLSLCPSSCESVATAVGEGETVMMELVVAEA